MKHPYLGLVGPERQLVQLLHEAGQGLGRPRWEVVADLVDLGSAALRSQLMVDPAAEGEYLEVVGRLRRGCFAGDESRLCGAGLDPRGCLWVQAWDVDARCARSAWLQFTVANIAAEVVVGDSLAQEIRGRWLTPAAVGSPRTTVQPRWGVA